MTTEITHLTPQDLSDRWQGRIKPGTLAQWRSLGRGPRYIKLGRNILYAVKAVEDWEAEQERANTAQNTERSATSVRPAFKPEDFIPLK